MCLICSDCKFCTCVYCLLTLLSPAAWCSWSRGTNFQKKQGPCAKERGRPLIILCVSPPVMFNAMYISWLTKLNSEGVVPCRQRNWVVIDWLSKGVQYPFSTSVYYEIIRIMIKSSFGDVFSNLQTVAEDWKSQQWLERLVESRNRLEVSTQIHSGVKLFLPLFGYLSFLPTDGEWSSLLAYLLLESTLPGDN